MFFSKIKKALFKNNSPEKDFDIACVKIGELKITLARKIESRVPHEFSVIIPRVEIREKGFRDGCFYEKETIYNSVTIVHSPQNRLSESAHVGKEKNVKLLKSFTRESQVTIKK